MKRTVLTIITFLLLLVASTGSTLAAGNELSAYDKKVLSWARACQQEVVKKLETMLNKGTLKEAELFDTFYVPIPNTQPQKFHTRYDRKTDEELQPLLDTCLQKDAKLVFVVLVDQNGYLPTHNSKYSRPLTGDMEYDAKWNRAKRLFNDRTGLAAAKNKEAYLVQRYDRDTGEQMVDLSIPIRINKRHWGALRVAYQP